jgi:hypothetical protein
MRHVRGVARVTLALVLGAALGQTDDDVFEARMKDAQQNEESPAGKLYDTAFQKEFGMGYAPRLNECAKKTGGPQSEPFDVLMKLAATGTVEEALVRPRTPFSQCFMQLSKKGSFAKPPFPGYWVAARMRFPRQ